MRRLKDAPKARAQLTEFEMEVYRFIKRHGELLTSSVPAKMMGAVPNLRKKGLIEIFKKPTSSLSSKKRKFVRVKEENA